MGQGGRCWLCGRPGRYDDPLDRHHIWGGARRGLSEQYGAVVELHHRECHIFGPKAAHNCAETAQRLREYGQRLVMEEQGWDEETFRAVFGKSWL